MTLREAGDWALFALAVIVVVFTLVYMVRSPWRRNRVGIVYAVKSITMSFVLLQVSLSVITSSDYLGRDQLRWTIYTAGFLVYVPMLWSLVVEQNEDRRRREDDHAE